MAKKGNFLGQGRYTQTCGYSKKHLLGKHLRDFLTIFVLDFLKNLWISRTFFQKMKNLFVMTLFSTKYEHYY